MKINWQLYSVAAQEENTVLLTNIVSQLKHETQKTESALKSQKLFFIDGES
jgi:hypothetical protein